MSELHHSNFEAVALDFDGTLCDTHSLHDAARIEAFRQMSAETGDQRFINVPIKVQAEAHQHGSNPYTIIGWVLQQAGIVGSDAENNPLTYEVVERKNEIFAQKMEAGGEAIRGSVLFTLRLLSRMPGQVAIVTTARRDTELMPFLARYNLDEFFQNSKLVTHESVENSMLKPDPKAYEIALNRFDIHDQPDRLLAIEDSAHGIKAAKRAGATVAAIATTHSPDELIQFEGGRQPDAVARNFAHLSAMMGI